MRGRGSRQDLEGWLRRKTAPALPRPKPTSHRDGPTQTISAPAATVTVLVRAVAPAACLADLEEFVHDHRMHGSLAVDATELAWNGYLLTLVYSRGVVFERWVTPEEALRIYSVSRLEIEAPDGGDERVGRRSAPRRSRPRPRVEVGPSWKSRVKRSGVRASSDEPTRMIAVLRIARKPSAARTRAAQIKVACGSCHGATVSPQSAA